MRLFLVFLTLCSFVFLSERSQAQTETIVAVVNEDAITISDLEDRMRMIIISSGLPNTSEIRERLASQVINSLIDEQLRLQEARRLDIEIEDKEIQKGFEVIAQQNNFEREKFETVLEQSGINLDTMRRQIKTQMAWTKVVQSELRPQISISDSDIESYLNRLKTDLGKPEYLLAEIFLPVDDPKNEADTRNLANRLSQEIRSGKAPFSKIAQQFSQAAGAPQGGDVGWVQRGHMADEIDQALPGLKQGEASTPIRSVGGYHILLVRSQRTITEESIPERQQVINILGSERLERMQRRRLLDLKSTAFIENRIDVL